MSRGEIHGYAYILIGTTLWGVSSVVAKSLFNIGLPPAELVLIRLTLAALTLLFILLLFNRKKIFISPKDLPYFFVLGFVGVAGVQFTYYYTISKIHVGPAVLIQYLCPVWIAFYAVLFQRESLSKAKIVALLLAILGCYLMAGGYRFDLLKMNNIGMLSGIISSSSSHFFYADSTDGYILKRRNKRSLYDLCR